MDNTHQELAKRVGIKEGKDPSVLGIAFMRTFTSPGVSPALEDCFLVVPVKKTALGEVYLMLKEAIEKDPESYGFSKVK